MSNRKPRMDGVISMKSATALHVCGNIEPAGKAELSRVMTA